VDTLVVKNIPFHLPDVDFISILNAFEAKPKQVRYIYDKAGGGGFKGMAFVKYNRDVNINAIMAALQGLDIMGRKLRIELKRTPAQAQQQPQQAQLQPMSPYEETASHDKPSPQRVPNGRPRRGTVERRGREEEALVEPPFGSYGSYGSNFSSSFGSSSVGSPTTSWEPSRKRTTRSVSKGGNSYIPRGPDGTKGFSSDYQTRRTTFPPSQPIVPIANGDAIDEPSRELAVADEVIVQ
jgi:RNA recognition motif-containing protein